MTDDLLDLAEHLARKERGRPKHASLRRAVSTAYYAVFHALARLCAEELVGWSKPWTAVTPIYRSIDHSGARRLFEKARDGREYGPQVAEIGRIFIGLQQQRHVADYDPEPLKYGRETVLNLVDQARRAADDIRALPAETRLMIAVHLVVKTR